MEAKLHKLKVTELKELLAKNHLVQTGKKDELIKRLLDNNVHVGDEEQEQDVETELVDPDLEDVPPPSASAEGVNAPASAPHPQAVESTPAISTPAPETDNSTLTPEQQAKKARAERFGIPFNPNATKSAADRKSTEKTKSTSATPTPKREEVQPKQKAGAIDPNPLGLSEEVLARRAAKFGLPEKKEVPAAPAPAPVPTPATKPAEKKEAPKEVDPELAARIAAEEEKKRKRAEKFGTATTTSTTQMVMVRTGLQSQRRKRQKYKT